MCCCRYSGTAFQLGLRILSHLNLNLLKGQVFIIKLNFKVTLFPTHLLIKWVLVDILNHLKYR